MYRVVLKPTAALILCGAFASPAQAVEVYLFKGAGDFSFISEGLHFSRGLERIADQLNQEGIRAEVRGFAGVEDALATIRRRKPESVAFIGHSMGAVASLGLARQMRAEGIRVSYLGLIDIPGPVGTAGANVEWAQNYYSIHPVYGKLTNTKSHPNAQNIHVSGQIHTTMDDSRKVREGMLAALRKVHAAEMQQQMAPLTAQAPFSHELQPATQPLSSNAVPETAATFSSTDPYASPEWASGGNGQEPYVLPGPGQQPAENPYQYQQTQPQQQAVYGNELDQTTTASTTGGRLMETGKSLLNQAVDLVNRLGSGTRKPPARQPVGR